MLGEAPHRRAIIGAHQASSSASLFHHRRFGGKLRFSLQGGNIRFRGIHLKF
jgi:hypothetical protein